MTKNGPGREHFREPVVGVNRYAKPYDLCLPSWKPEAVFAVRRATRVCCVSA